LREVPQHTPPTHSQRASPAQTLRRPMSSSPADPPGTLYDIGAAHPVRARGPDSWRLVGMTVRVPNTLWDAQLRGRSDCRVSAFIGPHAFTQGGAAPAYVITDLHDNLHYAVRASFLAFILPTTERRRLAKLGLPRVRNDAS
jgi:hypothetical protein